MNDDIEPVDSPFGEITVNLAYLTDTTLITLYRQYVERNMSPATLSKFDVMCADSGLALEDIIYQVVFNDAIIQLVEQRLRSEQSPIPPFNI